jgi:hypothetical protein
MSLGNLGIRLFHLGMTSASHERGILIEHVRLVAYRRKATLDGLDRHLQSRTRIASVLLNFLGDEFQSAGSHDFASNSSLNNSDEIVFGVRLESDCILKL